MRRFFKVKNFFLISFLAVAGIFSAGAFAVNKQSEDSNVVEKADASYNLGTGGKNVFFHDRGNWSSDGARLVLEAFNWKDYQESGGKEWVDFASASVVGSTDKVFVAKPATNKESLKILRLNPKNSDDNWGYINAYGNLKDYPTEKNVFQSTTNAAKPGGAELKSETYNLYYVTLAGSNATSVTMNKVGSTTNTLTKDNSKPCYCSESYELTATGPNGWNISWSISGAGGSGGSASYVSGYSSTSNPTRIKNITDDITITATYTNPWTSYTMQYSWDNSNWTSMDSGTQENCLRKYYTHSAISQTSGNSLYLRYNNGTENINVTTSQMGLVGGEGANNFELVSSRPTIRFSNVTGYIDVRVTHDGSSLHFYCWAKGINDDNGKDTGDTYGRFGFIINDEYHASTYKYNDSSTRGRKEEWYISSIDLVEGDTIKFLEEYTNGGSDYGTDFNVQYVDTDQGANGVSLHDGVATVDYTGTFQLYVVWGGSGFDYLYCNRLTRIVSYEMQGHGSQISTVYDVTKGSKISAPDPVPTATGYTFGGWYKEAACTHAWNFASDTVDDDTPLYAKWTAVTYTITYDGLDGATVVANPESYTIETTTFTLNNPTKDGYTFKGWSGTSLDGDTNKSVSVTVGSTGNRSYTANWTLNQYTLTLTVGTGIDRIYYKINDAGSFSYVTATTNLSVNFGSIYYLYATAKDGYILSDDYDDYTSSSPYSNTKSSSTQSWAPITISGETAAINYAKSFNITVGGVCAGYNTNTKADFIAVWNTNGTNSRMEYNYSQLPGYVKYWLAESTKSSDSNVITMLAKYDYVLSKYGYGTGSDNLHDYLGRIPTPKAAIRDFSPFSLIAGDKENSLSTIIIIIASSVSLLSITALSVLLVKKRKAKQD